MYLFSHTLSFITTFFSPLVAHAYDLGLPSFANSTDPASLVNNIYMYALGIAGTLAVVMIVYGGVKYVVTGGNSSAQKDATEIIKSAVWGIVLLGGAFLILNTINPTLTVLKNPGLTQVQIVAPTSTGLGTTGVPPSSTTNTDTQESQLALKYLAIKGGDGLSSSASCVAESSPRAIMQDVSLGRYPYVCSPDCSCTAGGLSGTVTLTYNLLQKLTTAEQARKTGGVDNFTVSSLTGGSHAATSNHYNGSAADITSNAGTLASWQNIFNYFKSIGADPHYEFTTTDNSVCGNTTCYTTSSTVGQHIVDSASGNRHLHINF